MGLTAALKGAVSSTKNIKSGRKTSLTHQEQYTLFAKIKHHIYSFQPRSVQLNAIHINNRPIEVNETKKKSHS